MKASILLNHFMNRFVNNLN